MYRKSRSLYATYALHVAGDWLPGASRIDGRQEHSPMGPYRRQVRLMASCKVRLALSRPSQMILLVVRQPLRIVSRESIDCIQENYIIRSQIYSTVSTTASPTPVTPHLTHISYVDVDYAGCQDTRRSASGQVFIMAGAPAPRWLCSHGRYGPLPEPQGRISPNIFAACRFNLLFCYSLTGWEGSAADGRVFHDAHRKGFAIIPGTYYLGDARFQWCALPLTRMEEIWKLKVLFAEVHHRTC